MTRVTRRGLQLVLAVLWLLDAALQFQPYMFTRGFGRDVVAPAGDGQPGIVAAPVHLAGHVIAAHPVAANVVFAVIQLALGLGLLHRTTARIALLGSIGWSAGVWWLGEGLGGLLSGHATLLTGAPGAVALYAVLAVAAYPQRSGDDRYVGPSSWALRGWVGVWILGGILQALPAQNGGAGIAAALRDSAATAPGWLAPTDRFLAQSIGRHVAFVVALVALQLLIAAAAVMPGATRIASVVAGAVLATGFWAFGQSFGLVLSGQSTDPNSGPLLLVLAVAALAAGRLRPNQCGRCDESQVICPSHEEKQCCLAHTPGGWELLPSR